MSESRDILREEFHDEEYRHAYAEDLLNTKIATQIRVLREQRGWTQADLAGKIGTKQAGVSRLENVNYSGWKIETLKRIARAFDVTFNAGFETFSKLLNEAEEFSRKSLEKSSFHDDPGFHETVKVSADIQATITRANNPLLPKAVQPDTVHPVTRIYSTSPVRVTYDNTVTSPGSQLILSSKPDELVGDVLIQSQLEGDLSLQK